MPRRVLILSASVGSGHKSAATAIEQALRRFPDVEVQNQDALKLTSWFYQVTAADAYFALARENPWLIGWWYDVNDEPFRNETGALRLWNMLNSERLVEAILDYKPDIIVCTHFMPAGIVAQLMSQDRLETTLSIVTTDYDFQGMWLSRIFNRYFVAIEETRHLLITLGIAPDRVTTSGIPVNPDLSGQIDRAAVMVRYNLRDDLPILLVSAGALGGGPAGEIVAQIMGMTTPVQTIVICGRNKALRDAVTAQTAACAERFRVLGFTTDMPDLMRAATLFIGKPGGLSSAECMAAGLPMLIIDPIPGQEERNSDHLLENGAAVRCRSTLTIGFKLDQIFADPERLERLRAGTRRLGRPDAALVVAEQLLADEAAPLHFNRDERQRIIAAAKGALPGVEQGTPPENLVSLYDDDTGIYLGAISPPDLLFLSKYLEDEGAHDDTYYIDEPTITFLEEHQGSPTLLKTLRQIVAERGHVEVRYVMGGG